MSPAKKGVCLGAAVICLALALFLPTGWYDALPRQPGLPPLPLRGTTLLRLIFLIEAVILGVFAFTWRPGDVVKEATRATTHGKVVEGDISRSSALLILLAITTLATILRTVGLGSDLWIDEITPLVDYGSLPIVQVVGSYLRSNNHLLNTLLVRVSLAMFGESEWSVRLPALLFGVAGVPALYWLARLAVSRAAALAAALMLATSYHHIFFSQNARGYTAYLFFALVSGAALIRAVSSDRPFHWATYVTSVVLGFASLITMVFVFAGQILIGLVAVTGQRQHGSGGGTTAGRLIVISGVAGLLSLQLYAASLPEAYVVITSVYQEKGTGFAPFSLDFVNEVVRGVTAGFAGVPAAALFAVVGILGFGALLLASWKVAGVLALPLALVGGLLAARGLTFSPRFFLLGVPLALLSAVAALEVVIAFARRRVSVSRRAGTATVALFALLISGAFAASLPYYYRTPKQPYRASLRYIESLLRPGDRVAIVHNAESGFRYYTARDPVRDAQAYHYVRTRVAIDSVLRMAGESNTYVVTTLPRMLGVELPELPARINECCEAVRYFHGTLGDGGITVWKARRQ